MSDVFVAAARHPGAPSCPPRPTRYSVAPFQGLRLRPHCAPLYGRDSHAEHAARVVVAETAPVGPLPPVSCPSLNPHCASIGRTAGRLSLPFAAQGPGG